MWFFASRIRLRSVRPGPEKARRVYLQSICLTPYPGG